MKKRLSAFILLLTLSHLGWAATDPTRPYDAFLDIQTIGESGGSLTLYATYIYPEYRLAIINGQIFKIGDKINEFTISSIDQNTVELTNAKLEKTILRIGTMVKQKSAT